MMHTKHYWDYKRFMTPRANNSVKSILYVSAQVQQFGCLFYFTWKRKS